jgi:hypothetical protein
MGFEEIYGVLFMMPVHLAGLFGCAWAWNRRADPGARAASVATAAAACASACSALILFLWGGACSRYIAELVAGWTVVTSVGLMAVFGAEPGVRPGRAVRVLAAAAACWTVACVWLASAEYRGFMARTNPRAYAAAAPALDYPSLWWARWRGIRFGPASVSIRVPPGPDGTRTTLVASGRPNRANQLILERLDAGHVRLDLIQNEFLLLRSPALAAADGRLDIRLEAPWLYPPPADPYWDGLGPAAALDLQTLFRIGWGAGSAEAHSIHSVDPVGFEPAVAGPGQAEPGAPFVASFGPAAASP